LASEAKGRLQARAVLVYQKEVASRAAGLPSRGAQAVCNEFMALHKAETGENILLNHGTIINLSKGGLTKAETNAAKGWLLPKEVTLAISYIGEIGSRGFPLSHERLKQHVDEILQARIGDEFPQGGVGKRWTNRFVEKHS
ncbi:hypothetical protein BOTBODRAFT_77380, partial [Botryobasidium botryosum FD-172 SS1]